MRFLISSLFIVLLTQTAQVQAACGGSFASFIGDIKTEARGLGYSRSAVDQFFSGASQNPKTPKPQNPLYIIEFDCDYYNYNYRFAID